MSVENTSLGFGKAADSAGQSKAAVLCAWIAIWMSLGNSHSAFAQNKAAQTAAGAIIIQNNQMRQELRETRRELREIKEGLGIEPAPSNSGTDDTALPLAILLGFVGILITAGLLVLGGVRVSAMLTGSFADRKLAEELQHIRAGRCDEAQVAWVNAKGGFVTGVMCILNLMAWPLVIFNDMLSSGFPKMYGQNGLSVSAVIINGVVVAAGFSLFWCIMLIILYAPKRAYKQRREALCGILSASGHFPPDINWAKTERGVQEYWSQLQGVNSTPQDGDAVRAARAAMAIEVKAKGQAGPAVASFSWFVRLPDGTIRGPLEKATIEVMAKRGEYPSGTQWSNSESGPWVVLVKAQAVADTFKKFWVRTPQGMSGGPYTKEQLSKAMAAGRIPDGSEAASSPHGPWRKITAKRS